MIIKEREMSVKIGQMTHQFAQWEEKYKKKKQIVKSMQSTISSMSVQLHRMRANMQGEGGNQSSGHRSISGNNTNHAEDSTSLSRQL